ncbi:MAG: sulfatase-like hydrolase/transferase [Alphaproteobacteria bacterium]|nr:sulfatase-like hydrolase/transferase [Alphaproteobacteria bacterium]
MANPKKKILFIVIDQMRADLLNGALAEHINLSNLRAFQDEAVTFLNHFTVTNPCGPARASLLTGQYAMNHRAVANGVPLADGTPNIATEARKAGYMPMLFGYTDITLDPTDRHPNDPDVGSEETVMTGFHEVVEMRFLESYPWRAHLKANGYENRPYHEFFHPVSSNPGQLAEPDDPAFYRAEHSDTAFLTDQVLHNLAARTDQSWFAHVTYIRPHPPLVAPAPYNKMYDPADMPDPVPAGSSHPLVELANQRLTMQATVRGVRELGPDDLKTLRAIYFGLATEVDHHIGRILNFLKETGQYDDTLIVITADHGEMLGDLGLWAKQHVFDPAYHVSLMIRDPDQPAQHGVKINALTESIDVAPTLLETVGVPVPVSMNGASLRPFLCGETPENWRQYVQLELDFNDLGPDRIKALGLHSSQANLAILRSEKMKLVHFNGGFEPLLFDLENDPCEQVNLAHDPAHAADLLRMTRDLLSFRMHHLDQRMMEARKAMSG